ELGTQVLRQLAEINADSRNARITVLLRASAVATQDSSKKRALEELQILGIHILQADVINDSGETLAEHFRHFDTVISCVGFVAGAGTQLKLTQAALKAGVKRYVPWQFGVDYDVIGKGSPQDLFDEQLEVRELLRAQRTTQWLIISTGMFTSFLFEPAFGVVDLAKNTVHALGTWDTQVTVTTPEDIGKLTALIIFAEPRLIDQVVFVAGDTLSYRQLADILDEKLGRTLSRVECTVPQLNAALAAAPHDSLCKYRAVFAQGKGVAWDKKRTFNATHGIELTTVADWVEQNLVPAKGALV
ncbi:MAG: aromatic alcohol reductase, partial [Pseudomonas caspiana]